MSILFTVNLYKRWPPLTTSIPLLPCLLGCIRSQNVWSLAISPGQTTLQRNEFYVAMRAVALAQSGEDTLTPEKVRETATNSVTIATFKGWAKPPITSSKGKKATKGLKWFSKTAPASNKGDVPTKYKRFSKAEPGSSKGAVPTTLPTSGLTKEVEDGAGSSSRADVAAVHSTKSEFEKRVDASEKETNNEIGRYA